MERSDPADPYKISPHPPLVSQVCLRCGAEVGSRSIHDAWHDSLDKRIGDVGRFAIPVCQPHLDEHGLA